VASPAFLLTSDLRDRVLARAAMFAQAQVRDRHRLDERIHLLVAWRYSFVLAQVRGWGRTIGGSCCARFDHRLGQQGDALERQFAGSGEAFA
jgi:hypothetical protein